MKIKSDKYFVSICIPSYNRPNQLRRLLDSIDCSKEYGVEIVICEDNAPKREEIRTTVDIYINSSPYEVKYIENEKNLGYDGNIRELVNQAEGEFIIFMGDDDMFVPCELDNFICFLEKNCQLGYVLRAYRNIDSSGKEERFTYYPEIKYFENSEDTYIELYRKSVFISGVTFKREYLLQYNTSQFDGTLLYQLYLVAEICLKYPSAAYNIPFTQGIIEKKEFYFGNSEAEREFRIPNKITIEGERKFLKSFLEISLFIDSKYHLSSTAQILRDMSKYSFPMIAIMRKEGLSEFNKYVKVLREIGLGCTVFFHLYVAGLIVIGENGCKKLIYIIKKLLGRTPRL